MANTDNDPQVILLRQCGAATSCGEPMGSLRVYKGAGETDRRHLRGALVQTCTGCHWTKFHAGPYKFSDAEQLVLRILNPGLIQHVGTFLRPPSPVAVMPPLTQAGRIDCANLPCSTKAGARTQGSKSCIEYKCKPCCINAALQALANGLGRPRCNAHNQASVAERPIVQAIDSAPAVPTPAPVTIPSPPVPSMSSHETNFNIDPQLLTASVPSTTTPLPSSSLSPTFRPIPSSTSLPNPSPPVASQPSPLPPPLAVSRGSGRSLAQPLDPLWANVRNQAVNEKEKLKTAKAQTQAMDDRRRRTCLLILYHTEGEEPLRLQHYVETFPQFQLRTIASFTKDFGLLPEATLDFWQGEWTTITLDTPIMIERAQRVLLRLRPNLMTAMKDCLGLEKELALQPTRRPTSNKRAAPPLVSPLKKASRCDQDSDTSTSRPHSDPLANPIAAANNIPNPLPLPLPNSQRINLKSKHTSKAEPNASTSHERKWPKDFFVCEIADGFAEIQKLKKEDKNEKYTFSDVFSGVKYTKSTVWKYKKIWKSAKSSLKDDYIKRGRSTSATFSNFLSALNGKSNSRSGSENEASSSSSSESEEEETTIMSVGAGVTVSDGVLDEGGTVCGSQGGDGDGESSEIAGLETARLCPFCDQPIKTTPSPTLSAMLAELRKKTWLDPLPDNPQHRKARSFTVFASFCERHRFESIHVPHALSQGWPTEINFSQLFDRVMGLEDVLREILADPEESSFFQTAKKYHPSTRKNEWNKFSEQGAG